MQQSGYYTNCTAQRRIQPHHLFIWWIATCLVGSNMDILCNGWCKKPINTQRTAYKKDHVTSTALTTLKLTSLIYRSANQDQLLAMKTSTIQLIGICIVLHCTLLLTSSVPTVQCQRRQLPCTHPLRLSAPELFTHCSSATCTYSSWSSWERVSGSETSVAQSQCQSGQAYTEERTRSATGSGCNQPVKETRRICKHIDWLLSACYYNIINIKIL